MNDTIKGALIGAVIPSAVSVFIFLAGNFSTQETLEKSAVQTLSQYFDSVKKDMEYEEALQTISKENNTLKNEIKNLDIKISGLNKEIETKQKEINDRKKEINQQISDKKINTIVQSATDYWNECDYIQALLLLKKSEYISDEVKILYEQYSEEYCNILIKKSEKLIKEKNKSKALEILKEGSALVNDGKILENKINDINNKPSMLLVNLTPVSGEIERIWDTGERDNYGNVYASGICLHQAYEKAAHVVYPLDGKYTMLTGKFVLGEESKNTDGNYKLYVYSLVDGNMDLIYESKVLSTATRPIDIEIDVTDVMDLVIEVYDPDKTSDNALTGLVNAKLE